MASLLQSVSLAAMIVTLAVPAQAFGGRCAPVLLAGVQTQRTCSNPLHLSMNANLQESSVSRRNAVFTALAGAIAIASGRPADAAFDLMPAALRNIRDSAAKKRGIAVEEEAVAPEAAPAPKRGFTMPKFGPMRKSKVASDAETAPAPAPAPRAAKKAVDDDVPRAKLDLSQLKPDLSILEPKIKRQTVAGATGKEKFDTDDTLRLEEKLKRRASKVDEEAEKLKAQGAPPAEPSLFNK